MQEDLVQKYNLPVPRYTSYPAVPYWTGAPEASTWIEQLSQHYDSETGIELYLHIPFCEKLCYYCGCHRVISKNKERGMEYAEYLLKEWQLYLGHLTGKINGPLKVSSLHLGGGTPNFLTANVLEYFFLTLSENFSDDFVGSVEIDPRTCTRDQLEVFRKFGFTRLSMGVQDFDPKVQEAIGRVQPYAKVRDVCLEARALGFEDLNFDLIYGLPYQSPQSIQETIAKVLTLAPHQIAFYSYAHLPQKLKNQKLIPSDALPQGAQKRFLYDLGKTKLEAAGYHEIGLDHFAKQDSLLSQAKTKGLLRRNFMGHTFKVSPLIIGLGASSISSSTVSFAQNAKDLKDYFQALDQEQFPLAHGHIHSELDIKIEKIMQNFFAREYLEKNQWQELPHLALIEEKLAALAADDLIEMSHDQLQVTELGKPFMRIIASVFDYYYQHSQAQKTGSRAL